MKIPNSILDALGGAGLNGTEYAVLLCAVRFTYGYQRAEHPLSATFISRWTGQSISSVKRALKRLRAMRILKCSKANGTMAAVLSINENVGEWATSAELN